MKSIKTSTEICCHINKIGTVNDHAPPTIIIFIIMYIGFSWADESPIEYVSWGPGEPSGTNGDEQDEQCTQMYTNGGHVGQWNDLYCLEKWPFVCKYTTGIFTKELFL